MGVVRQEARKNDFPKAAKIATRFKLLNDRVKSQVNKLIAQCKSEKNNRNIEALKSSFKHLKSGFFKFFK